MRDAGSLIKRGLIASVLLGLVLTGCASASKSAAKDTPEQLARLQKVEVRETGESTMVVITLDKPVSFTSVRMPEPPRMVVDLAGVDMGGFTETTKVDKPPVTEIKPVKVPNAPRIGRLEIALSKNTDLKTTQDGGTINILFAKPAPEKQPAAKETKPSDAQAKEATPAAAPVKPEETKTTVATAPEQPKAQPSAAAPEQPKKQETAAKTEQPKTQTAAAPEQPKKQDAAAAGQPKVHAAAVAVPAKTQAPATAAAKQATPALPPAKTIKEITALKRGDSYQVSIAGDGRFASTECFMLGKDRIVVDVMGVGAVKDYGQIEVGGQTLKRVRMAAYKVKPGKVRVVLDLASPAEYEVNSEGSNLVVTVSPAAKKATEAASAKAPEKAAVSVKEKAPEKSEAKAEAKAAAKADSKAPEQAAVTPTARTAAAKPADEAKAPVKTAAKAAVKVAKATAKSSAKVPAKAPAKAPVEATVTTPAKTAAPEPVKAAAKEAPAKDTTQAKAPVEAAVATPAKTAATEPVKAAAKEAPAKEAAPAKAAEPAKAPAPATVAEAKSKPAAPVKKDGINVYISRDGRTVLSSAPIEDSKAVDKTKDYVETQTKIYTGGRISFDIQDADLDKVIGLLADVANLNLIIDPAEVKGKVTLKLDNVPWDQALDILLRIYNLDKVIEGNVLRVASKSRLDDERRRDLLQQAEQKKLEQQAQDLYTRTFKVNYMTASELEPQVKKILSSRGDATANPRTNELVVTDIRENLDKAGKLIAVLDKEVKQIMIEARLITVDVGYTQSLGVSWGLTKHSSTTNPNLGFTTGSEGLSSSKNPKGPNGDTTTNGPNNSPGYQLNLPAALTAASGAGGGILGAMSWGSVLKDVNIDLTLSALESINKAETLAAPKVFTLENQAATITSGTTIFVQTTTAAGTAPQPLNANLSLTVTPRVTGDNLILMEVTATNNTPSQNTFGGVAAINTQQVTTRVLVKDGDTIVLGGIYTKNKSRDDSHVPLLGRIPIIKYLFSNRNWNDTTSELLIFITPKLMATTLASQV